MAAIKIPKKTINNFNTPVEWEVALATVDVESKAETFTYNVSGRDRPLIYIENNGAAPEDTITYELVGGNSPFTKKQVGVVKGGKKVFVEVENGYTDGGKLVTIILTPAKGKKLLTDLSAKIGVLETL